jgi:hypothetical protein
MQGCRSRQAQGPGTCHLFHFPSLSGLRHELDAAGIGDSAVVIEAKDVAGGIAKGDIDVVNGKTTDYFGYASIHGFGASLHRVLWSTTGTSELRRKYAARVGIILVSPDVLPLPTLLAASEMLDPWFTDALLAEFVTLAEQACRPLTRGIAMPNWTREQLTDLTFLQAEATDAWLNHLDQYDPLYFEQFAATALPLVNGAAATRTTTTIIS